jgi:hypothetical protein
MGNQFVKLIFSPNGCGLAPSSQTINRILIDILLASNASRKIDLTNSGPGKSMALLSTFRNGFSAFRCYVSVLPAGGEGAEAAESRKYIDVSGK